MGRIRTTRQRDMSTAHLLPVLLRTPPDMAHARRLPPLVLQTAQRAAVRDLDVHVQQVPPDALDRHCPSTGTVRVLVAMVAGARLGERAARLARPGDEAATAPGETKLIVVEPLEVATPRGVLRLERGAAPRQRAARRRGGPDADGLEGVGKGTLYDPLTSRRTLRGAVRNVVGGVRGSVGVRLVVRVVRLALERPRSTEAGVEYPLVSNS